MNASENAKAAVWRKAQRNHGISIPLSVRRAIDNDLEGLNITHLESLVNLVVRSIKLSTDDKLRPIPKKIKRIPYKRNPHSLEKRLNLYSFVMNKHLAGRKCLNDSCDPKTRYDWKTLTAAWNKAHPSYDPMTAARLKYAFNNAQRDKEVMKRYSEQKKQEAIKLNQDYNEFLQWMTDELNDRKAYLGTLDGVNHVFSIIQERMPTKYNDYVFTVKIVFTDENDLIRNARVSSVSFHGINEHEWSKYKDGKFTMQRIDSVGKVIEEIKVDTRAAIALLRKESDERTHKK